MLLGLNVKTSDNDEEIADATTEINLMKILFKDAP